MMGKKILLKDKINKNIITYIYNYQTSICYKAINTLLMNNDTHLFSTIKHYSQCWRKTAERKKKLSHRAYTWFHYGRGFVPLWKGVYSAYAKLARVFLPRMQNVKGGLFRYAVFMEGCFFRRGFIPYTVTSSCLFGFVAICKQVSF